MGVVHPGAPRPWLYLISERRARAPGAGVETVYPSAATYYHEAVYPSAAGLRNSDKSKDLVILLPLKRSVYALLSA